MSSLPRSDPEAELRHLASLVAECRELAGKLDRLNVDSGTRAAPFLFRQLGQSLQLLGQSVQTAVERAQEGSSPGTTSSQGDGLFGRLKRSILGSSKKDVEQKLDEGLQGNSWTIAIPELIGFLSNARKTGALWVHAPSETFLLQLRDGVLLHATSDSTPEGERLGELLVSEGALTAEELSSFLSHPSRPGMLGMSLHSEGLITERQLLDALAMQVQRLFHRMLSARSSVFRFQEGIELLIEHHVQLNCMQLLLETAKMFDERSLRDLEAAATGSETTTASTELTTEDVLDAVLGDPLEEVPAVRTDPEQGDGESPAADDGDAEQELESAGKD